MKISAEEFLKTPRKAITLIGMSGAGKTHISCQLEKWGWTNYSCDFVIGDQYLRDELENAGELSAENIGALSTFLGKLGGAQYGGFDFTLFRARQKAYYDAEVEALKAMGHVMARTNGHFVHDSTGSLCEIEDDAVMRDVGARTVFVYLKTGTEEEADVLQRAQDYPKPLFFPPDFLNAKVNDYMEEIGVASVDEIVPDDFSRWVFPKLFEARKPKYQRLADLYGVTISAHRFKNLSSSDQFVDIIAEHLE